MWDCSAFSSHDSCGCNVCTLSYNSRYRQSVRVKDGSAWGSGDMLTRDFFHNNQTLVSLLVSSALEHSTHLRVLLSVPLVSQTKVTAQNMQCEFRNPVSIEHIVLIYIMHFEFCKKEENASASMEINRSAKQHLEEPSTLLL